MEYYVKVYDTYSNKLRSETICCGKMFNSEFWNSKMFREISKNYNRFSTLLYDFKGCNSATRDFRYNIKYLKQNLKILIYIKFICKIMKVSLYQYLKMGLACFDIISQASLNRNTK